MKPVDPSFRFAAKHYVLVMLGLFLGGSLSARPPEEPEINAARAIGERVAEWIEEMEKRPYSVAIYSVHTNYPLEQDYSTLVETEVLKALTDKKFEKVVSCTECRTPHVAVRDDKVVVTKGAFDVETMKKVGLKQQVEVFVVLEVFRTKLSVVAEAALFQNGTGNLLSAERIKVPALNISDAAAQFLILLGPGKEFGSRVSSSAGMSTSADLMLLEDIGFAKAGLDLGGVFGGQNTVFYLDPTLSFRGRFGNSYLGYGLSLGIGYGFATGAKGLAFRGAYDLFLGTLGVLGVGGIYFLPDKSGVNTFSSFLGFHVGIAIGR